MPSRPKQYRPNPKPQPRPTSAARGTRHERGYTARWSKVSKLYLQQHPTCVLCAERGRIEAATCVDHIDGLGPLGPRGYDETNFRSLCTSCHNSRSARDRHAKNRGASP
ncbi:HNH endonuclease [Gemmata massiliana]|uniref:HNH endonuclease n=1 Tax=Gemmata massiliana TaxID=1210884 RepID=UPI0013A6BD35|nr:HNH endonuclease [Gemmata massiliana]